MITDEIIGIIKGELKEFENNHGFYDIPMEWPFNEDIDVKIVQRILSSEDPKRELDNVFYEMLESYFFSEDFSPTRQEIIVKQFISQETIDFIVKNKYSLNEFIENCVNFKVDDSKLQNQMIDVDILVDTGDANYDFTPNIFANSRYSNILGIETVQDLPSYSSLVWLCEQQGISKKELLDYLHGNSTCFDLKDKLLQTTLDESQSTRKAMNVLTFCIKMPLSDAIEINRVINHEKNENDFIRPKKRKGKSYITISKDCTAGLYSPWESSGGDFSISLIEDVKLPIKYIYSANVGDTVGTPIKNIYMDIEYKESLVAINKVHDKALDDIIYDAKVILSANDKRYESKDEIIEGRSEL